MANKGREYEIAFKLNAELESSFRKSFGSASESIGNIEKDLRQLSQSNAFDRIGADARKAGNTIESLEKDARGFGDTLKRVAEYTGAFTIVQGVVGSFQDIVGTVGEFQSSMKQVQAATGASATEMAEVEKIAKELYRTPIGEGFKDITDALTVAKQVTKQEGDTLKETTRNAIAFRDVFGEDVKESVKAADTMVKQFGINSSQAYNLLAQGAQKGLNKSNELLDSANEYAPQFAALGFTANQMFDIFSAGLEAGAFNLDKVGDAAKEFNIRLKDGSKSTTEAMAQLFAPNNIEDFAAALTKGGTESAEYLELLQHVSKDTAKQLVDNLKKGSSDAMNALYSIFGDSEKLFTDLSNGSKTGAQAMQLVISKLQAIKDPLQRNQLGVALFGTQFEDLEQTVIAAMGSARSQFDLTKQTMDEVAKTKYDTIGADFQLIGRQLMTDLILPIAQDLMPVLKKLAAWAGENKDLMKFLALAVPAAMIGKNAVSVVKGFGMVEGAVAKAATGASFASRSVGMLGSALTFFTNPVGIAVAAVGALTLGIIAYKQHQEKARQQLINMGKELQEASNNYKEVANKAKLTNDLVWEYRELDKIIKSNTDSSKDLTTEKARLAEITKQLQQLHPQTITQYDVENGKIKEKLGLVKQESDAERELSRLKLEKEVAEKSRDTTKLEDEIGSLEKQTAEFQKQKAAMDAAIPAFREFEVQFAKIMQQTPSDDRTASLEELRKKVNEVGESVGYHFNANAQLMSLGDTIDDLTQKRIESIDKYVTKLGELGQSKSSYEELYQAQKNLIELNLGGKLEEQASKFNRLSAEEKARFNEAAAAVIQLNKEMNLIPTEKKINVSVAWQNSGWGNVNLAERFIKENTPKQQPASPMFVNPKPYAEGGFATSPHFGVFGEAGPEAYIPLNDSPRSHALLDATNRIMGRDTGGGNVTVTFAPQITVQGGGADASGQFEQALRKAQDEFERRFSAMMKQERRLNFNV
ncbi:phage tail tape measure protein [Paenibacillus tyrfis]|uniref:Phage tail tape measure protein domain-containing protein n=1 Tax=Paenibacillus tyrfis TaxID=1501230 RepID=A0A081NV33_9BACL|nr:phage tail tape measure protein [Paenibacillus tyrfis]KEQ22306.1 hypothetical protein ET33_26395 [Paenibacillus tyrfis]